MEEADCRAVSVLGGGVAVGPVVFVAPLRKLQAEFLSGSTPKLHCSRLSLSSSILRLDDDELNVPLPKFLQLRLQNWHRLLPTLAAEHRLSISPLVPNLGQTKEPKVKPRSSIVIMC